MSAAGAALLSSALAQALTTHRVELAAETVCWIALPALVHISARLRRGSDGDAEASKPLLNAFTHGAVTSTRAWLFALAIVAAAWYRDAVQVIVLFPVLTPLLLLSGLHPISASTTTTKSRSLWPPSVTDLWPATVIAAFSCYLLVHSVRPTVPIVALCLGVVALLHAGYLALSRPTFAGSALDAEAAASKEGAADAAADSQAEDVAWPLALRIVPLMVLGVGVRILVLHQLYTPAALRTAVLAGLAKALSWFFILKATRDSSWCVASTIGTFAITAIPIHRLDSESHLKVAAHFGVSLLSLGQTIHLIPKGTRPRSRLWALSVIPLLPFLAHMTGMIHMTTPSSSFPSTPRPISSPPVMGQPSNSSGVEHPVDALARQAETQFNAMLARQSHDYPSAEAHYRLRYGMEPPPGFEAWYDFAKAHQSPIIDEFDSIYESIAPFLRISGQKVKEAVAEAGAADDEFLFKCTFTGRTAKVHCRRRRGVGYVQDAFDRWYGALGRTQGTLERWLADVKGVPDVDFLFNYLDEPRVVLPKAGTTGNEGLQMSRLDKQSIWDVVTRNCPGAAGAPRQQRSVAVETYDVSFVTDTVADKDLCRHREYGHMHGLLMSPTTFTLMNGTVPVLSSGSLSTMGDVLLPSPAYAEGRFTYDEQQDVEWDQKRNNLYWAGSTTGGYATDDSWKQFHRHRFVELAQGLYKFPYVYLRRRGRNLQQVASAEFNRGLYDVAFTDIVQCDNGTCEAMQKYFEVRPWAGKDAAFESRLVFDADGNGMSGRFVKLLSSRSAVLKQALLREWHDERLAPWVHYIPVSLGLGELPELVEWLTGTEEGQARAKLVGERGMEWAARAIRDEDRAIYMYRLLLELARAQDPVREAM